MTKALTHGQALCTATATLLLLLPVPPAFAGPKPPYQPTAPRPPQLLAAKTAFVSNSSMAPLGDSDKIYDNIYGSLQQLNRFTLVQDPAAADLILEYSTGPLPGLINMSVKIIDGKTHIVLWSTSQSGQAKDFYEGGANAKSIHEIADYVRDATSPQPATTPNTKGKP